MGTTMLDFVVKTYGAAAPDEAWSEFSGVEEPFEPRTPNIALFMSWFFHRWSPDPHDTAAVDAAISERIPTQLYLEREDRRLEPALRRYLESCLRAPFSFTKSCGVIGVVALTHATSSRVKNDSSWNAARPKEWRRATSSSASSSMWTAFPCSNAPVPTASLRSEKSRSSTSARSCSTGRRSARQRSYRSGISNSSRNTSRSPRRCFTRACRKCTIPMAIRSRCTDWLSTSTRQNLSSVHSRISILTERQMSCSLKLSAPLAGEINRVEWTWKKSGNERHKSWSNTILGHLEIKGRKLIAEVNSARRALELRTLIETRLAEAARFRTDTIQSLEKLLGDRPPFNPAEATAQKKAEELAEHPEIKAAMQNFIAQHFEHWVSESIPALDGRTPLEAVRHPEGREKVLALVVDAERRARKMTPPVDEAVLQRVRERLGLPLET